MKANGLVVRASLSMVEAVAYNRSCSANLVRLDEFQRWVEQGTTS